MHSFVYSLLMEILMKGKWLAGRLDSGRRVTQKPHRCKMAQIPAKSGECALMNNQYHGPLDKKQQCTQHEGGTPAKRNIPKHEDGNLSSTALPSLAFSSGLENFFQRMVHF